MSSGGSVSDGAAPEGALKTRMEAAAIDATARPNFVRMRREDTGN